MTRLSEAEVAEGAPVLGAVPQVESDPKGGLFANLFSRKNEQSAPAEPDMVLAGEETPDGVSTEPAELGEGEVVNVAVSPEKKRGLFGLFRAKPEPSDAPEAVVTPAALPASEGDPSLAPEELGVTADLTDTPEADPVEPKKRRGLFAGLAPDKPEAEAPKSDVAFGAVLPYGIVARICDVPKRELGKKIAQYPQKRPRHLLYDSDPGNTGPHTFFLTGFDDGCARQFTASLAVFGSVEMHEQLRYGLPSEVQPYSDTDKAYEKLKSKICGVPRKKPCGGKIGRIQSDTVFLSIYERFGGNARWSNLLLHSGEVLAHDTKGG